MKAIDLVKDPTFIAFCRIWEENERCPEPFADWLGENLGEMYLEAAKEAYRANRKGANSTIRDKGTSFKRKVGLRPFNFGDVRLTWAHNSVDRAMYGSFVIVEVFRKLAYYESGDDRSRIYRSYEEAIADYLDAYCEVHSCQPAPTA